MSADAHPRAAERLRPLCPTISAGILSADLMDLGGELARLERAGVPLVHVDVMDGCFCPSLTVGPPYVKGLRTPLLKDVHLLINEPLDGLEEYVAAGADLITIQVESAVHIHRVLQRLGEFESLREPGTKIVRGLAFSPATSLEWLTPPLLEEVDLITLLAVDPGWPGQKLSPCVFPRLAQVRQIIAQSGRDILTCVDGGITKDNIAALAQAGADLIVTGSALFGGDAEDNAREMLATVRAASPLGGQN